MKQRQRDEVAVGPGQPFVVGRDLAAPQDVVVGPGRRPWAAPCCRRCNGPPSAGCRRPAARGLSRRRRTAPRTGPPWRAGRRRAASAPPSCAMTATQSRPGQESRTRAASAGWGDRCPDGGVPGEIGQLFGARPRVGRHGDCADARQRVPGEQVLRRVLQMDHDPVARPDAALQQAVRQPGRVLCEGRIGPGCRRTVEGRPGQEFPPAMGLRPLQQQACQIQAGIGADIRFVGHRRMVSTQLLQGSCFRRRLPPDGCGKTTCRVSRARFRRPG